MKKKSSIISSDFSHLSYWDKKISTVSIILDTVKTSTIGAVAQCGMARYKKKNASVNKKNKFKY